jgi:hypothetical protein
MNDFDAAAGTGGGYDKTIEMEFNVGDGITRRIVARFRGHPRTGRVSIVLEQVRTGEHGVLIRYDDAHRRFHRHAPGWPEPSERIEAILGEVAISARVAYAVAEIRARYTDWEAEVFGREGEPGR